jgi:hypothetical protein
MRRHSLCVVGATSQGQHLPLPDVPKGLRRAIRFLCRDREKRFRLDPRSTGRVPLLLRRRARFLRRLRHPLTFRRIDGPHIEIMTGTFDRPDRLVPIRQYGTEARLGWVVAIANLPSQTTFQSYSQEKLGDIVSHQHPDHD